MSTESRQIHLSKIRLSRLLLRPLDATKVSEIAASMKVHGLLQPIRVRPVGDEFEIIFGNHRLAAAKQVNWESILCDIVPADDVQAFEMALSENEARNEFIDAISESKGFQLMKDKGFTETQIGQRISKTQQYVSSRLALLRLPSELQQLVSQGILPTEHAYELSKLQNEKVRAILAELSRRDVRNSLTLQALRDAAKKPLEELAKDPRVEAILMRDPVERIKRVEAWVTTLQYNQSKLKDTTEAEDNRLTRRLDGVGERVSTLEFHGTWRRDHCTHNSCGVCQFWHWNSPITKWNLVQDGDKWRLQVSEHPEYCATCPDYTKKT